MKDIICWWSGGVTSAVACMLAIKLFGKDRIRIIFIDTGNESKDTYHFLKECEKWYGIKIETITGLSKKYPNIRSVWRAFKTLNTANGAICSSVLKRDVRLKWERENQFTHQVFGYDIDEPKRAKSMTLNYPKAKAIYPLLFHGMSKQHSIDYLNGHGIYIPQSYKDGKSNNNCEETGCVRGGIGYWQYIEIHEPWKFDIMADEEHYLTDLRGEPVTMLKDQSNEAKELVKKTGNKKLQLVFLKPHPDYPEIKDLSMMKGRPPKPLKDCNGFGCAVDDLMPINPTHKELSDLKPRTPPTGSVQWES